MELFGVHVNIVLVAAPVSLRSCVPNAILQVLVINSSVLLYCILFIEILKNYSIFIIGIWGISQRIR